MRISFSSLPDDARLWVYAAQDALSAQAETELLSSLEHFVDDWRSHGRPVHAAVQVVDRQFLVVGAFIPGGEISGCGIDASVHAVDHAAQQLGLAWAAPLHIAYRDQAGGVQFTSRGGFRKLIQADAVDPETPVFDLSLTTVGAFRTSGLERPAHQSWHARVFRLALPSS
ncbi:MAG: hypothetical protein AAGI71_05400 [Bacteroidota bacterium]